MLRKVKPRKREKARPREKVKEELVRRSAIPVFAADDETRAGFVDCDDDFHERSDLIMQLASTDTLLERPRDMLKLELCFGGDVVDCFVNSSDSLLDEVMRRKMTHGDDLVVRAVFRSTDREITVELAVQEQNEILVVSFDESIYVLVALSQRDRVFATARLAPHVAYLGAVRVCAVFNGDGEGKVLRMLQKTHRTQPNIDGPLVLL